MNEIELPLYDVEEVTLEEAILMLATDEEKFEAVYTETSERILTMCA
ncbi:MAG: hypothetical protein P8Y24_12180 [Gammaproteobacteria bacterium]